MLRAAGCCASGSAQAPTPAGVLSAMPPPSPSAVRGCLCQPRAGSSSPPRSQASGFVGYAGRTSAWRPHRRQPALPRLGVLSPSSSAGSPATAAAAARGIPVLGSHAGPATGRRRHGGSRCLLQIEQCSGGRPCARPPPMLRAHGSFRLDSLRPLAQRVGAAGAAERHAALPLWVYSLNCPTIELLQPNRSAAVLQSHSPCEGWRSFLRCAKNTAS